MCMCVFMLWDGDATELTVQLVLVHGGVAQIPDAVGG